MFESSPELEGLKRASSRRKFLAGSAAGAVLLTWWKLSGPGATHAAISPKKITIIEFSDAGVRQGAASVPMVVKSEDEWKKQLPEDSFEVTRHADTEVPFSGALLSEHDKGVFRCICCDTALFDSATKFESGSGWPSFYQPIAKENVEQIHDTSFGMERTAVDCARCEAHLGHVFNDGPRPTGLRYCINSVALRFAKADAKA